MSSKLGTILSMIFVVLYIVLGLDLISIQFIYSDLDAKAASVAYLISKNKGVTSSLVESIEERYNVTFICLNDCVITDNIVDFALSTTYQPFFISKDEMNIVITRQAVIGYYG